MSDRPQDGVPSVDADATKPQPETQRPSRTIGPYRLLHLVGEGGMGEVWLAEQTHPVRRQVALKVIKAGMDTAQVVTRFEAERQALALMDHPAIATVYDGGSTPEGRPYFAMEYVKGEPITAYCDRQRLTTQARLELFMQVCEGVQHAHQKGIIHRDLKPSNVLVAIQDDHPVPKIIDFGVAKATAQHLTERTLYTELGVMIGTPEYMSPEQAEMGGLDIDTRTDVYALGVILYELLTGALPFDRKELRQAGFAEIQRTIREKEPPRPSTRITQLGPASTEAATNRHTEPRRLASELRGDLDWVTMRALEKDRTRRYQTANALAADVRHHLSNEPVSAGPPGTIYRAGKFVRRHRFGVAAAATVALLLVTLAATMTVQARRIARERDRANREAETAKQVSEFLVGMFETTNPFEGRGKDVPVGDVLDRGAQRIATELRGQPEVRAALMNTMGRVYYDLGVYDKAAELVEEALTYRERTQGRGSLAVAASLNSLGAIKLEQGAHKDAEAMLEESLEIRRRLLGPDSAPVAETLVSLGALREGMGDWAGSEAIFREALAIHRKVLAPDDLALATSLNDLALVIGQEEKFEESEKLYRESTAIRRKRLGNEHPFVAQSLNNIGMLYVRQRRHAEAEPLFKEALAINRKAVGDVHPVVASNLNNLALVYMNTNRLPEAEEYFRQVVVLDRKIGGETGPRLPNALQSLGVVLTRERKFPEAEACLREAMALKRKRFAADHWEVATTKNLLGACLTDEGKYAAAEPLLLQSQAVIERQFGPTHDRTRVATARVVALYERWGKPDKAAEWRATLPKPAAPAPVK
jgi:non-specific serine/threonine protein kinase/serine/threonine-protein kinase